MVIVLLGLLLGSIIVHLFVNGFCAQGSISGYYFTSAQAMFVGIMFAVGACLIIYQGDGVQNAWLDVSGFMAFIVALVPADIDKTCEKPLDVNVAPEIVTTPNLATTLPPVLVCGVGAFAWLALQRSRKLELTVIIRAASALVVIAAAIWAGVDTVGFTNNAHTFAAWALFIGLIGVVVSASLQDGAYLGYRVVAGLMALTLVVWLGLYLTVKPSHLTLVGELALIAEFVLFWLMQTEHERGKAGYGSPYGGKKEGAGHGGVQGNRSSDSPSVLGTG
ncbi:hypothetical protein ACFWNN_26985 [Lentzea sp. NPDC058450]|uniref:hypothetical protein n=1 Tax=Lentzea sp. NPDC058450 TaxID=3346505 RepID=UPI0036680D24